jgi:hypothetical protein
MAIDTQNKRRSASGEVGPVPDGSLALAADRRHIAALYRFADGGGGGPPPIDNTPLTGLPRRLRIRKRKLAGF